MSLKISKTLELPDEAVTQTFGILAKRGVGKTYTANVMTEEMLKKGHHVVVIDPIGVWYGLRSSADGKKPGLPIIIAGGEHADIPITPENGELLANMIIDNRLSMVVDVSLFRKGQQVKFMTDFAETLYRRNRNALHLILDEADAFAPQRPMPGEQRLLGAMEDIVRRGRARGIGVTMITQRPSVLNKNVLTQIEVLIALRLTAPIDQKAVDEWVKTNAEAGEREEFLANIGSLDIGTAYFWSPGWLKIFKKIKVRKRETLDSSSTPIAGQEVVKPEKMADVDLDALRGQLEAVAVEIDSNDPKALKKRIKELERQIGEKPKPVETVRIEVLPEALVKSVLGFVKSLRDVADNLEKLLIDDAKKNTPDIVAANKRALAKGGIIENPGPILVGEQGPESLSSYAMSLLETMAERYPMQITRAQLAILSGRKPRSSAFGVAIADLKRENLILVDDSAYELTEAGIRLVGVDVNRKKKTAEEIRSMWLNALPTYERDLLTEILQHRDGITRDDLARRTGRSITSSGFGVAISTLKKNGLVLNKGGKISPVEVFYEGES